MKIDRRSRFVLFLALALAGCGGAPLPSEEPTAESAQALGGVIANPGPGTIVNPPEPVRVPYGRLAWTRSETIEVWTLDQLGGVMSKLVLDRPGPSWWAMGLAGDRMLVAADNSNWADLWTLGSGPTPATSPPSPPGQPTRVLWLDDPEIGASFRATGLALDLTPGTGCYRRTDDQVFWVTWNDPADVSAPNKDMLARAVYGDGRVQVSHVIAKPALTDALSFGLGADDFMHVLVRDTGTHATGRIFRANVAGPGYALAPTPVAKRHVDNREPTALTLWRQPPNPMLSPVSPFPPTTPPGPSHTPVEDWMLTTSQFPNMTGNDSAELWRFNQSAQYVDSRTYELAGRGTAGAYTWLPPVCP